MLTKFKNDNTLLFYNAAVVLEAYDIQLNLILKKLTWNMRCFVHFKIFKKIQRIYET